MNHPRPTRILHVLGTMNRGGAEMRLFELMRAIDRSRIEFEFCALSGQVGSLHQQIVALGGAVHPCKLGVGFMPRFAQLVRRGGFDVVHSHVHLTTGFVLAIAQALGVPQRIAHFRSTTDGRGTSLPREVYRRAARLALDVSATDILAVSTASMALGWSESWARDPRCQVILNGVDAARFDAPGARASVLAELGLAPTIRLAVQLGNIRYEKNHPFAADVLAALPDAHLVFVGRGGSPEEIETRRRLTASSALARAHFVGERDDVPRWLAAADATLLPSLVEGLPGAALESLAAGTPVVASDLPGVREIAGHLPGVTIHRLDEPAARWAASLAAALRSPPDDATRAASRARFRASPFSLETSVAAHVAIWTKPRASRPV